MAMPAEMDPPGLLMYRLMSLVGSCPSRNSSSATMTLAEADEAAAKLTAALRKRGIEAYCFRDHYASIVTIGSFNDISIVNPQTGQTEAIPEIQRMYREYGATQDPTKGNGPESVRLKGE